MNDPQRPILGLSGAEAARILGLHELSVARLVRRGVLYKPAKRQQFALERAEVEAHALGRWKPGHPYWLSTGEAAEVLGLSPRRVNQLAAEGRLPAVERDRRRFYRRHQIEVIANAREARLVR